MTKQHLANGLCAALLLYGVYASLLALFHVGMLLTLIGSDQGRAVVNKVRMMPPAEDVSLDRDFGLDVGYTCQTLSHRVVSNEIYASEYFKPDLDEVLWNQQLQKVQLNKQEIPCFVSSLGHAYLIPDLSWFSVFSSLFIAPLWILLGLSLRVAVVATRSL